MKGIISVGIEYQGVNTESYFQKGFFFGDYHILK